MRRSRVRPRAGFGDLHVEAFRVEEEWLRAAIGEHARNLLENRAVLKNEHKTAITRVELDGRRAIVKQYRYIGPRFWLKGLFRAHPGRRSLRAAMAMEDRGIPTPPVLGLVERVRLKGATESWFVTEDLAGVIEMDRYILRNFDIGCDFRRRRAFTLSFAQALHELMMSGVLHRDLKTCNILVGEDADSWRFSFIDLDDVVVRARGRRPDLDEWILALAQLNPSTPKILPWTDRMRFLERLDELRASNKRPLIAKVQAISRHRGRAYFSDEGPVEIDFV